MCDQPKACPSIRSSRQINGPFSQRNFCMFQSAVSTVPWCWGMGAQGVTCQDCLSHCYGPLGPRNTSPLATRARQSKMSPAWTLLSTVGFSKAAGGSWEPGKSLALLMQEECWGQTAPASLLSRLGKSAGGGGWWTASYKGGKSVK